jgi:hypothetical protein
MPERGEKRLLVNLGSIENSVVWLTGRAAAVTVARRLKYFRGIGGAGSILPRSYIRNPWGVIRNCEYPASVFW